MSRRSESVLRSDRRRICNTRACSRGAGRHECSTRAGRTPPGVRSTQTRRGAQKRAGFSLPDEQSRPSPPTGLANERPRQPSRLPKQPSRAIRNSEPNALRAQAVTSGAASSSGQPLLSCGHERASGTTARGLRRAWAWRPGPLDEVARPQGRLAGCRLAGCPGYAHLRQPAGGRGSPLDASSERPALQGERGSRAGYSGRARFDDPAARVV